MVVTCLIRRQQLMLQGLKDPCADFPKLSEYYERSRSVLRMTSILQQGLCSFSQKNKIQKNEKTKKRKNEKRKKKKEKRKKKKEKEKRKRKRKRKEEKKEEKRKRKETFESL